TGFEPATSGLTERGGLNPVEQFDYMFFSITHTYMSPRWSARARSRGSQRIARRGLVTVVTERDPWGISPVGRHLHVVVDRSIGLPLIPRGGHRRHSWLRSRSDRAPSHGSPRGV